MSEIFSGQAEHDRDPSAGKDLDDTADLEQLSPEDQADWEALKRAVRRELDGD
jgi:hypothetical protein